MHYAKNAYGIDKNSWTIRPKNIYMNEASKMGQRESLSKLDIQKINAMYKCSKQG